VQGATQPGGATLGGYEFQWTECANLDPMATFIAERAIEKYGEFGRAPRFPSVLLVGSLTTDGIGVGGTYDVSENRVIVSVKSCNAHLWVNYEEAIHHELSSIFLRQSGDGASVLDAVQTAGGGAASYVGDPQRCLDLSPRMSVKAFERGFVCDYGAATPEDDFNTLAGSLWTRGADLTRRAARFPKLRAKLELVFEFYSKLDPNFTRRRLRRMLPVFLQFEDAEVEAERR
jgi:hypothetical protein